LNKSEKIIRWSIIIQQSHIEFEADGFTQWICTNLEVVENSGLSTDGKELILNRSKSLQKG